MANSLSKNLAWLRGENPRLYEIISAMTQQHSNLAQQVNGNSTGQPLPPPTVNNLTVTAQNGHFSAAIQDNGSIFRGVNYFLEHSDSPNFTNPQTIHLGDTRNHTVFLGNVTRYFRAYSSYASSAPSSPVYHGSATRPLAVTGGGLIGGPSFSASQGSGTGSPGQGLQGPGRIPFRSTTGVPPTR